MSVRLLLVFKSFNQDVSTMWTGDTRKYVRHMAPIFANCMKLVRSGIGLPKKRILYTVLRSPHIDKKSREQFEMKIYKQYFHTILCTNRCRQILTSLILQDNPGVQCKVVIQYKTRTHLRCTQCVSVASIGNHSSFAQ